MVGLIACVCCYYAEGTKCPFELLDTLALPFYVLYLKGALWNNPDYRLLCQKNLNCRKILIINKGARQVCLNCL